MAMSSNKKTARSPPRRKREADSSRESFYCMYCKTQLLSKSANDEHNKSISHKTKIELIEKALDDSLNFCYSCENVYTTKVELDAHCLMSRHQPLYRVEEIYELKKMKEERVEKSGKKKSKSLKESLHSSEDEHAELSEKDKRRLEEKKKRNAIVMSLKKLKETDKDDAARDAKFRSKRDVFCTLCNVDCINASNYKIHVESWRHRAELDKKNGEKSSYFDKQASEKKDDKKENSEESKEPEEKSKDNKYEEAPRKHDQNKYEDDGKEDNLNINYFCQPCKAPCTGEENYIAHCMGKKHLRRIAMFKPPYGCYPCKEFYQVEKLYNKHLMSKSHINTAYRKRAEMIYKKRMEEQKRNDDWVEKKDNRRRDQRDQRDRQDSGGDYNKKDDRDHRREERRSSMDRYHYTKPKEQSNDNENDVAQKPKSTFNLSRTVEISKNTDLREKLGGKTNIVITRTNKSDKAKPATATDTSKPEENKETNVTSTSAENLVTLKERLTREREEDIATYQKFENTYRRLCEEEDFIRENLRVLAENDPRKEDYIRDLIRIQTDMREVKQELEYREMMIIKREAFFRSKFPDESKEVVLEQHPEETTVFDYHHGVDGAEKKEPDPERERLLKKLGPELETVDPALREKLLSVLLSNEKAQEQQKAKPSVEDKQLKDLEALNAREKQLEKELKQIRSKPVEKKKTSSLVPQYDDIDEKGAKKKRKKERSTSPESSSSESSSEEDTKKRSRRRKGESRGRSKRSRSASSDDRDRKKRKSSKSDKKKKRKDDEKKRKSEKYSKSEKKPIKMKLHARQTENMLQSMNPLAEEESEDDEVKVIGEKKNNQAVSQSVTIPVIGSASATMPQNEPIQSVDNQRFVPPTKDQIPPQRRAQFSEWNRAASVIDNPKEDVWDVAFSGGSNRAMEREDEALNLFAAGGEETKHDLPNQIMSLLRNVAPMFKNLTGDGNQGEPNRDDAAMMESLLRNEVNRFGRAEPPPSAPRIETFREHSPERRLEIHYRPPVHRPIEKDAQGEVRVRSILKKATSQPDEEADTPKPPEEVKIPGLEPDDVPMSDSSFNEQNDNKKEEEARYAQRNNKDDTASISSVGSHRSNASRLLQAEEGKRSSAGTPQPGGDPYRPPVQEEDPYRPREDYPPRQGMDEQLRRRDEYAPREEGYQLRNEGYRREKYHTRDASPSMRDNLPPRRMDELSQLSQRGELPPPGRRDEMPPARRDDRPPLGRDPMRREELPPPMSREEYLARKEAAMRGEFPPRREGPLPPRREEYYRERKMEMSPGEKPPQRPPFAGRSKGPPPQGARDALPPTARGAPPIGAREGPPPPANDAEELELPVRLPGESEEVFYARFERFYEMKRRRDEMRRRRPPPPAAHPRDMAADPRSAELYRRREMDERYRGHPPAYREPPVGRAFNPDMARRGPPPPGGDERFYDGERRRMMENPPPPRADAPRGFEQRPPFSPPNRGPAPPPPGKTNGAQQGSDPYAPPVAKRPPPLMANRPNY